MKKLLAMALMLALLLPALALAAMPDAAFLELCGEADAAVIARALEEGANPNAATESGETALMRVLGAEDGSGKAESVRLLLAAGANVNAATKFGGQTALIIAAQAARVEIVAALLEAGADANAVDSRGRSARVWAEFETFRAWVLGQGDGQAAQCVRLLQDRESPQTRQQHLRRAAALWGDYMISDGSMFVLTWLVLVALAPPLWAIMRLFRLNRKGRSLLFWLLWAGAAACLHWVSLRVALQTSGHYGEIWERCTCEMGEINWWLIPLARAFVLLVFVDAILLLVWLVHLWRRHRHQRNALPPAAPPGPQPT